MATETTSLRYLLNSEARRNLRTIAFIVYFALFQILILLQKPFLQVDFVFSFYTAFAFIFVHHLIIHFVIPLDNSPSRALASYGIDFLIIVLFMKSFPQLSSFLLVIQLFLLFLASFDLKFIQLCALGTIASFGISIMNLTVFQAGSMQNILSLALFNLSYIAVIIVSGQLKEEIYGIQSDLTRVQRKYKSQAEFSKVLLEKMPLGLAVSHDDVVVLQNNFVQNNLKLNELEVKNLVRLSAMQPHNDISFIPSHSSERHLFQFDRTSYFDEEMNQNLTISIIRDVTELRKLEEQIKQKDKLSAIGQLAAGIAHEIRNPLAGISGSVQLLSTEAQDPDQVKLMKIIMKEIDRLNNLITEFLDYAKPEKRPDQSVELSLIMEEIVQNVKLHSELSKKVRWNLQLNNLRVLGFSEKLKQAFLNIVINAVQALEQATDPQITITLSHVQSASMQTEKLVVLSIKDNGAGMKPETLKRLFEPFHTTKIKGTGLGLAVTHKILDAHGAVVEVKSEHGLGTEFIIKFPALGH